MTSPRAPVERFLVAWATGAVVGVAALGLEWYFLGSHPGPRAFAAYSLVGGALAAVGRSVFAFALSAHPARLATLLGLAGFAALEVLYFVNVRLLPAEHYLSLRSLAADAVVLLAFAVPFLALGGSHRASWARTRFATPLAAAGIAAMVAGLAIAARPPAGAAPIARSGGGGSARDLDVYVIVLDSVRRDRGVGAVGSTLMPALQALEREGRVFANGFAASSWTVPSVAEMLRSGPQRDGQRTLAEELAAAGWQTACFTDNPHLWKGSELLRGFGVVTRSVSTWRDPARGTVLGEVVERLAPGDDHKLADRVEVWLSRAQGPVFVYVHLMDAHAPYRFARLDGKRSRVRRIEFPMHGMSVTAEEEEDIRARYDAGVRRADAELGRLIATIRGRGRPYLAVVTSDHGESLGEVGRWFHGRTLAPELLAVPLVVLGAETRPGRVDASASNTGVRRTVLSATGLPCGECEGGDLRMGIGGPVQGGLPPHLAYRIVDRFKLVVDQQTGTRQLFDLSADPQERLDVLPRHREVAATLADGLGPDSTRFAPPADALERLRALGYAGH